MGETPVKEPGPYLSKQAEGLARARSLEELVGILVRIVKDIDARLIRLVRGQETLGRHFDQRLRELGGRMAKLESRLEEHAGLLEHVNGKLGKLSEEVGGLRREVGSNTSVLDALTEASLLQLYRGVLESSGYRLVEWVRNMSLEGEDIDLFARVRRGEVEEVIVAEARVMPKHSDVGSLLAKAELVEARRGTRVDRRVLVGVYVGGEVRAYASKKGVEVLVF